MSQIHLARRGAHLFLGVLLCALTLPPAVEAASYHLDPILLNYWTQPSLQFANANKIAVGSFNHLHAVFANQDPFSAISDIIYAHFDPLDPWGWYEDYATSDGLSSEPALAVDSNGLAVMVWVTRPSAASSLGTIYYRHQTTLNCANCWSTPPQPVVFLGAEPSLAAWGGQVYLTWTTRDRVQFTSFPRASPPAMPLWLGEVVDSTNCPNTRFHQPSVAFTQPPCQSVNLKVAALFTSNEQSTVGPCQDADTHVGPRVYERDGSTLVWSTVFQDVVSDSTPSQPEPVAVALSFNANRVTGDYYLAWSDEQAGAPRTSLGHGKGLLWDTPFLVDNVRHHVHTAVKRGAPTGDFRLAVSGEGWSTGTYKRTGTWSGGSMSWTGWTGIAAPPYTLIGHPQAFYWSRCAAGQFSERAVYTEASDGTPTSPPTEVATGLFQNSPCPPVGLGPVIALPDCFQTRATIGQMVLSGKSVVLVDFGETAVVTRVSETGAEITSLSGGTIQATWQPGEVLSSWENGFVVATSRDSVRFSSKDVKLEVEDLGLIGNQGKK